MLLDGHKEGVILQPFSVLPDKFPEILILLEAGEGDFQKPGALVVELAEVHPTGLGAPVDAFQLPGQQKSLPDQGIQVDEVMVAREGGEGLVGAVAVARGT